MIVKIKPGEKVEITVPEEGKEGYLLRYGDDLPILITKAEILNELRQLL